MKSKFLNNAVATLALIILIVTVKLITALPWWFYVIPVHIAGIASYKAKWQFSGFIVGFSAGLLVWIGANIFFDVLSTGDILVKVGQLMSVPKIIVILVAGIMGGLVTALALYTGRNILHKKTSKLVLQSVSE